MVTILRRLIDEKIAAVIAQQITTLENSFTLKMEILLRKRTLSRENTHTEHTDRLYDRLQQKNARSQNKIRDLTREFRSTVSAKTPLIWTPTTTATQLPSVPDSRVAAAAANR